MRVLYSFPDELGRPGIGTTAFNQVRQVAAEGVEVMLYCTSLRGELPENVRVVETLTMGGRRIPHRVLGIGRTYRYHDRRVAAALRRLGREIDVVHCWPRATVQTARAARQQRIPCLREVPNTHTAHAFEVVEREFQRLGLRPVPGHSHSFDPKVLALEQEEYELASLLLVPSEFSLGTFVERGVPREKLVLHRYGYDADRFYASPNGVPDRGERPFTALFVGRCEPRKGLHYALEAWFGSAASQDGRFIICGSFEPEYRELLEPFLSRPGIELRGFVSDPAPLMRESDVFILPSVEEGSALVTYEARACGCVLLVSKAAGAICRHDVDGLVHTPGDVSTLRDQLTRLRQDRPSLERLRRASLEGAEDVSWATAGKSLMRIYERARETVRSGKPELL